VLFRSRDDHRGDRHAEQGAPEPRQLGALFGVPITAVIVAMVSFYRLTLEERRQRLRGLQPVGGHAAGVGHEADELGSDLVAATVAPGSTPTA